ncbi:MAG TPA: ubiquinol-cytochrome C chaperone family protein [Pseudolabrys sp.]
MGQGVFDRFCRDMDDNLREIGIADLKVSKEMQRMGEAYYGRSQAYRAALAAHDDAALVAALERNIYAGAPAAPGRRLAAYMREALRGLAGQDASRLASGELHFPDPVLVPEIAS